MKNQAASSLQATLAREEARRKVLIRRTLVIVAAALIVAAAAVVVVSGNAAEASRTAQSSEALTQSEPIVPSTVATEVPPAEEPLDSAAVPSTASPAPEEATADSVKATPPAPKAATSPPKAKATSVPKTQNIRIGIGVTGYSPSTVTASAGSPIVLTVDRGEGCAGGFLMPALNVAADNTAGPVTIDLGRVPAGSYQFTCGMEMIGGSLTVK